MTQEGFGGITKQGIRLTNLHAYKYCSPSRRYGSLLLLFF